MAFKFQGIYPIGDADPQAMPVKDCDSAAKYYTEKLGFQIRARITSPDRAIIVGRDNIDIRLVENGQDPLAHSCFIATDNVDAAYTYMQNLGLDISNRRTDRDGEDVYEVFFLKDPEGLCYCIGQSISA
ncbi:Glyoxalase/bleomycin resistance protein/dioxygenase [Thalassoporum mexicanum PCC 7367]|uniref:VOC family protein n=1 Tax=Thalassoporum mexicanum TaxID=3457544 RepID=UPI00029F831B|nr:VOC family protein [Pseudanabaena sp. PCC 7367]AFY71315.1 Glyoxalase/bleomycin resistance protein/dioxygenase [Pseudanabaena sp. PCC 7367]